jgi:hypothetical protein
MSAERDPQSLKPAPRVDSFEVIDADCTPLLTDEERGWPVVALQPRVDSFEVIEPAPATGEDAVVIRVSVPSGTPPEDVSLVVQKLRAAAEEARSITGGRFPIHIDAPIRAG